MQFLPGVGPRRAEAFAALGVHTVRDLLEYFPFRHEPELGEIEIADLKPDVTATVRGEVHRVRRRWPHFSAEIYDGTEWCRLQWFNDRHSGSHLYVGAQVIATGRVEFYDDKPVLVHPRVQVFAPDAELPPPAVRGPRLVGVYSASAQLQSRTIRQIVERVLKQGPSVEEFLPESLRKRHRLPARADAVRTMHQPKSEAALQRARRRLAYEELLLLELGMALRRQRNLALHSGRVLAVTPEIDRRIRARFPFTLTAAQDRVIREIAHDLQSGRPMTRLLQGDVGSGKTVVALYASLAAIANRRQAAIMAPTEILAAQHFARVEAYLHGSRVRRALLTGALSRRRRSDMLAAIERGEIDLIVGTQALLEQDVAFRDLALVVVDEQHKFGVLQRANIRTKGPLPHYLVMTATPIPRTLAMTVFGDLDVSVLDASPPGRGRITTKVVTGGKWATVMQYVRERLEGGEQAYVVCPLIGEGTEARGHEGTQGQGAGGGERGAAGGQPQGRSAQSEPEAQARASSSAPPSPVVHRSREDAGAKDDNRKSGLGNRDAYSARTVYSKLVRGPWKDLRVGLLHGSLPSDEKRRVIDDFAAGRLHAIVSTTVVEVGVDVPAATVMIVENADRFGLSQLHQLRGRIGRGQRDSVCVYVARSRSRAAAERLRVLGETTDGFRIAEADLRLRGPGELFGTRQHGLPELRVASLVDDFALLEQARRDAFDLVRADPSLERPTHIPLKHALRRLFRGKMSLIDAG